MSRGSRKEQHMRMRLAQEAAKVMLEAGSRDFAMAKRKAAEHLGATDTRQLPTNLEVEQALAEYQRLFRSEQQPQTLKKLREIAYNAMQFFHDFDPKLVGPVLSGTADTNTAITIHVFCDSIEDVTLMLINQQIPFETRDKRYRIGNDTYEQFPCLEFFAEQQKIDVVIFPHSRHHIRPMSPVDGRPMQRAGMSEVECLVAEAG